MFSKLEAEAREVVIIPFSFVPIKLFSLITVAQVKVGLLSVIDPYLTNNCHFFVVNIDTVQGRYY
jgi:hypothetical protein